MFAAWCWNTAWMASGLRELAAFRRDLRDPAAAQRRVLAQILSANRDSAFGRAHGFARIDTPAEFQRCVPTATYEEFRPYVDRIIAGEAGVLTAEPVTCLHPTGGTSGGEKLIPYTRSLQRQFHRALRTWIADLFRQCPTVRRGRAYWSLSPALGPRRRTKSGIPIGFGADTEYLSPAARWAARHMLVAPDWLAQVGDLETFRYLTLWHLLSAEDLALISVWSPTFLTGLLRDLSDWREPLLDDLAAGGPSRRVPLELRSAAALHGTGRLSSKRIQTLRTVLRKPALDAEALRAVWPNLALVSCWADGASAGPFDELRERLPHMSFQPKGLLATEGFTSIPRWNRPAAAAAVRSHFFEFAEATPACDARPKLLHELEVGGRYEVLLTTAGGFYRYRTGDGVTVVGREAHCPLVRFDGRLDGTSDLVGEKLSSAQVDAVLRTLWNRIGIRPAFALLTTVAAAPPRYRLYLQDARLNVAPLSALANELERGLAANPHYRYAVGLGQLAAAEIGLLDPNGPSAWNLYCRRATDQGRRLGDVKPVTLDGATSWEPVFRPLLIRCEVAGDIPT